MNPDLIDLLESFVAAEVRFLVVGGYAVGFHGHVRATKDLDVWIAADEENAPKVMKALLAFGAPLAGASERDFSTPGIGLRFGMPPLRIEVLTCIDGVTFEDAWPSRKMGMFGSVLVPVIGIDALLTNKQAAGRPQDVADIAALTALRSDGG